MTDLHAKIDLLEGKLATPLGGAAAGLARRSFAVLTLMRGDGTAGLGEASPLPGFSPDTIDTALGELEQLTHDPVLADPLGTPFDILSRVFSVHPVRCPSSRFALEAALLDWLGQSRGEPLHRVLAGDAERQSIAIADLLLAPDVSGWAGAVDTLLDQGATHVKIKIGVDLDREVAAIADIRRNHPALRLRLDGNQRVPLAALRRHSASLEALELELIEEPVLTAEWEAALDLPLPYALDETLLDAERSMRLLETGKVRAVVLKPTLLGGLRSSFDIAERAAACGADYLVSHAFDGPIARAATAELALALQTPLAAGLGWHPGLDLWAPHQTAAIRGRSIMPHDEPGLGIHFEEESHA